MSLRHSYRKKITIISILSCLILFTFRETHCPAFSSRDEAVSASLKKAQEKASKTSSQNTSSDTKRVLYHIGTDDILSISVWQDLLKLGKGGKGKERQYTINTGDVMEISVWQWPDLLKEVIVRPDGKISFPLVGDIQVEGLTLTELSNMLTKRLTEFIKSPQVSVMIKQFGIAGGSTRTTSGITSFVTGITSFVKIYDLSLDNIKVRPDGKISFPLVDDVQAEGLTLDELRDVLSSKISKYVNDPDVYVQVNEFGANKVIVLGEVLTPGVYKTSGVITALEAVSLAGGYTRDAILRNVFVLRGDLQKPTAIRLNLSKAITGRDFKENITLQPSDIVYVPRSLISDVSYILNELVQPLVSSSTATTGIKAIRAGTSPKQ